MCITKINHFKNIIKSIFVDIRLFFGLKIDLFDWNDEKLFDAVMTRYKKPTIDKIVQSLTE